MHLNQQQKAGSERFGTAPDTKTEENLFSWKRDTNMTSVWLNKTKSELLFSWKKGSTVISSRGATMSLDCSKTTPYAVAPSKLAESLGEVGVNLHRQVLTSMCHPEIKPST